MWTTRFEFLDFDGSSLRCYVDCGEVFYKLEFLSGDCVFSLDTHFSISEVSTRLVNGSLPGLVASIFWNMVSNVHGNK